MASQRLTVPAVVVSGLLHSLSQGILFTQAGSYSATCDEDSAKLKCFVFCVTVLAFAQTVLQISKLWIVAVFEKSWNDMPAAWLEVFTNGLLCTFIEAFLIHRCWKVSAKNKAVLITLSILAMSTFVSNIYLAIRFHDVVDTSGISPSDAVKGHIAFSYWMFGSLTLDISITFILLVFLLRSKTGLEHLDAVLNRIIHITWESASLPAVFMVIAVAILLSTAGTQTDLVLLFMCLTGKLYCHGFLRTLNSRRGLKEGLHDEKLGRTALTTIGGTQGITLERKSSKKRKPRNDYGAARRASPESTSVSEDTRTETLVNESIY